MTKEKLKDLYSEYPSVIRNLFNNYFITDQPDYTINMGALSKGADNFVYIDTISNGELFDMKSICQGNESLNFSNLIQQFNSLYANFGDAQTIDAHVVNMLNDTTGRYGIKSYVDVLFCLCYISYAINQITI